MFPIRPATSPETRRSRTEAAAHDASPAAGEDAQASPPASPALEALPRAASRRRPRPEDSPDEAPAARSYRAGSPMDASRATLSRLPAPSLDSMLQAWELRGAPGERRADAARRVLACSTAPAGAPTELDLSNLALSELPPGLDRLRLQSLVLVDNALSEIRLPDQGLPGLEELWLARNPLRDLTGLRQLPSLRSLYLDGCPLQGVSVDLDALTELRTLDLSACGLSELPRLEALAQLDSLLLEGNELSEVNVSALVTLQSLNLEGNMLRTPPDLRSLTRLTLVNLHENLLTIPPDFSQCRQLRSVFLGLNDLVALPDVRGLALRDLYLQANELRTLPDWIYRLPAGTTINLGENPLTEETLQRLRNHTGEVRILFGVEARLDEGAAPSLADQIDLWLASHAGTSAERGPLLRQAWAGFAKEEEAGQFARLLRDLTRTADFQTGNASRHALAQRVVEVLEALAQDAGLRRQCFEVAREGLGTCGDRVALTFSDIEAAARAVALRNDPDALWALGVGLWRLEEVNRIGLERLAALPGAVDEIEEMLALRRGLSEALKLPCQPQAMLYGSYARVTPEDLESTRQRVLAREEAHPDVLIASIAARPFWQACLAAQAECASAIDQLDERRAEQMKALEDEMEAPDSELRSGDFARRCLEIQKTHEEALQGLWVRFTKAHVEASFQAAFSDASDEREFHLSYIDDAVDRPLESAPPAQGAARRTLHLPEHLSAANRMAATAARIQALVHEGQAAQARALARELLQPTLLARLNSGWRQDSDMGSEEARRMNKANAKYMDLLAELTRQGLVDAREVFDRLLGRDGAARGEAPYLLHIASRAATELSRTVGVELAQSVTRLLATLARAREQTEGPRVRADMREALLTTEHTQRLGRHFKSKYDKLVDFYSRALLGGSQHSPGQASLTVAAGLDASGLLPSRDEVMAAALSSTRARKFDAVAAKASRLPEASRQPATGDRLEAVVRQLGELDIAAGRRADAQARAQATQQRREEAARFEIQSAVDSAMRERWESLASRVRKDLVPSTALGVLFPMEAAAHAEAAAAVPRHPPRDLVAKVCEALLSTPQGQALLQGLVRSGRPYRAGEHPDFHRMLQDATGAGVDTSLGRMRSRLRADAQATVASAATRDAAVQAQRASAEHAAMAQDTQRIRNAARQPFASPDGALPFAHGEATAIARTRRMQGQETEGRSETAPSAPPAALPGIAELEQRLANLRGTSEDLAAALPSVPSGPVRRDATTTRSAAPLEDSGRTGSHW